MQLAKAVGLTTVDVELIRVGEVDCIVVERFDRLRSEDGSVTRVHQEDICQALGYPPDQKYELAGRGRLGRGGGPEFCDIASLLDRYALSPLEELDKLTRAATFTALIGNSDAHGKNYALLHDGYGRVTLAPLYDTVPTILFPRLKDEAAMTIGGAVDLSAVDTAAIRREAKHWRVSADRMVDQALQFAESLAAAASKLDKSSAVRQLVERRSEQFLTSGS